MKIKKIFYSSHFERELKSQSIETKKIIAKRISMFQHDCFDPRLKTHKLHGGRKELWSFSITYSNRIVFEFIDDQSVGFIDVGDHAIYR